MKQSNGAKLAWKTHYPGHVKVDCQKCRKYILVQKEHVY